MPFGVNVSQEPFCDGWMSVPETDVNVLDGLIRAADWHFMWISDGTSRFSVGKTEDGASKSAIFLALQKVDPQFNAAELDQLQTTRHPGFYIARAFLHPRHIQRHGILGQADDINAHLDHVR
jgi:hypothetical protein